MVFLILTNRMTSRALIKIPLRRLAATRSFSLSCITAGGIPVGGTRDYEIKTETLQNKLKLVIADNEAAVGRVSIVFKAGSRFETPDNLGVTHALRVAAGSSTRNASRFAIVRNLQEVGAVLTCTGNREVIIYTLESLKDDVESCLPYLAEVALQQCFKPWEVSDDVPRLKLDLAVIPEIGYVIDLLHKAAFRKQGLGNSIYIADYHMGGITSETLQCYTSNYYTSERAALVCLGADECLIREFAECLKFSSSKEPNKINNYIGGSEIRWDTGGDYAYVAVVGEGGSLKNAQEALAFAVLQRAFGIGSPVKRGKENKSLLGKLTAKTDPSINVTAINISYFDTGVFGVLISAPHQKAGKILHDVLCLLKEGSVPDDIIDRAINQLRAAIFLALDSGHFAIDDIGTQAVLLGTVANACQLVKALETITPQIVNTAAKKVADTCDLSLAARGNLSYLPYIDELI